jgi:hypothetical protein
MKLSAAAFALALPSATFAFTSSSVIKNGASSALFSTMETPLRVAPDAGHVPDWEDRPGLPEEEYMKSNMLKPDRSGMWECPLTRWDSDK